jgi:hypothetical protein
LSLAALACRAAVQTSHLGKFVVPIKNVSIDRAHSRPSRIAHTTSDCPRRMSPAENTFGREVW